MADLPGLIEGAHQGVGLGHQFLRHVDRTRVLVHVVDMAALEGRDPYEDWVKINEELRQYREDLARRPQIVAANKMDLPDARDNLDAFRKKAGPEVPVYPISAATREGVRELLFAVADLLDQQPEQPLEEESGSGYKVYRSREPEDPFVIRRENEVFVVEGERVERLVAMTNFAYHDSVRRLARILREMGVEEALREKGAKEGDTVRIGGMEFELMD